jgi:hypothetical protein
VSSNLPIPQGDDKPKCVEYHLRVGEQGVSVCFVLRRQGRAVLEVDRTVSYVELYLLYVMIGDLISRLHGGGKT